MQAEVSKTPASRPRCPMGLSARPGHLLLLAPGHLPVEPSRPPRLKAYTYSFRALDFRPLEDMLIDSRSMECWIIDQLIAFHSPPGDVAIPFVIGAHSLHEPSRGAGMARSNSSTFSASA